MSEYMSAIQCIRKIRLNTVWPGTWSVVWTARSHAIIKQSFRATISDPLPLSRYVLMSLKKSEDTGATLLHCSKIREYIGHDPQPVIETWKCPSARGTRHSSLCVAMQRAGREARKK